MSVSFETPKVNKSHSSTMWQRTPSMSPTFSNTCRIGNDALFSPQDRNGADASRNNHDQVKRTPYEMQYPLHTPSRENMQRAPISKGTNEVDYYHNPTELFRWINYRRWNGAKSRVEAHPEEAYTWISSRHAENTSLQWRYLPLHLVCMQSYIKQQYMDDEHGDTLNSLNSVSNEDIEFHNQSLKDIELLVDELLRVYPQAVQEKDHEGMIPLHLTISRIDGGNAPNETVIMSLLLVYPYGVHVRDNYGRTPLDLLREKQKTNLNLNRTLRSLLRASQMTSTIKHENRKDNNRMTPSLHSISEDDSSQRIMQKVEQEIVQELSHSQDNIDTNELLTKISDVLKEELKMMEYDYFNAEMEIKPIKKERDDLISNREGLSQEINKHDEVVAQIRRDNDVEVERYKQQLSSLRSELCATQAVAEGIETQLRSKFLIKEDFSSVVTELEKKFDALSTTSSREKKILMDENDELKAELNQSNALLEEITQKKVTIEKHNNDMERYVDRLCCAFNRLLAQYDQAVETSSRNEAQLIRCIQAERAEYNASIDKLQKQLKVFDAFNSHQRQHFIDSATKEASLMEQFMDTKKRNTEEVTKIKSEFMDIRSQLTASDYIIPITGYGTNNTKSKILTPSENRDLRTDEYHYITVEKPDSPSDITTNRASKDIEHRPYPKVKSPFLLEMLEQRALESTFERTPTRQANRDRLSKTPSALSNDFGTVSNYLKSVDVCQPNNSTREEMAEEEMQSHLYEKSISLDEYSDIESRPSLSSSSTSSDDHENIYKGMRAAVKCGTIKVIQNTGMGDMSILRSKYSSPNGNR